MSLRPFSSVRAISVMPVPKAIPATLSALSHARRSANTDAATQPRTRVSATVTGMVPRVTRVPQGTLDPSAAW
jgi:hypothetical protein